MLCYLCCLLRGWAVLGFYHWNSIYKLFPSCSIYPIDNDTGLQVAPYHNWANPNAKRQQSIHNFHPSVIVIILSSLLKL